MPKVTVRHTRQPPPAWPCGPIIAVRIRNRGIVMHSSISVIPASGRMITVSMMLCDGAHVRTSAFTAADSANRIAHTHGTISATNIARIADTASHESSCTGHSTMHNGIDTYRNIIITLSSTFIHNSAMNTIAAMKRDQYDEDQSEPGVERKRAGPDDERRVEQQRDVVLHRSAAEQRPVEHLRDLHELGEDAGPRDDEPDRPDDPDEPLNRLEPARAAVAETGEVVAQNRKSQDRAEHPGGDRDSRVLQFRDVARVEVGDREQPVDDSGDQLRLDPAEDRLQHLHQRFHHGFGWVKDGVADPADRFHHRADDRDFRVGGRRCGERPGQGRDEDDAGDTHAQSDARPPLTRWHCEIEREAPRALARDCQRA